MPQRIVVATLALVTLAVASAVSCGTHLYGDRAMLIAMVNETDQDIDFFVSYDGGKLLHGALVPAHSQQVGPVQIIGDTLRILGRQTNDETVFDRTYRWKDLEREPERPIRIVVTQQSLSP